MPDDRRMTFIIVPHAGTRDLSTRTYEVSYRTLRRWLTAAGVVGVLLLAMAASWVFVAARAARATMLEQDVRSLRAEVAQKEQLRLLLERLEAQNRQMREMLGEGVISRPAPAGPDSTAPDTGQAMSGTTIHPLR